MPKNFGRFFVILGAVLMGSALLLFLYNRHEDRTAGQNAELLLSEVRSVIVEQSEESQPEETEPLSPEMPVVMIDGYGYIGYLRIPDLELELPVMSEWDYDRLRIAPCRQFGSSRIDNLVIAAHNYQSHFGKLSQLEIGAKITFTDMDDIENHYTLQKLSILAPDAVDAVQNSGYDLVLYTCTPGGATRVVAFCDRVEEETTGNP